MCLLLFQLLVGEGILVGILTGWEHRVHAMHNQVCAVVQLVLTLWDGQGQVIIDKHFQTVVVS